jgi:threonine dehydrogenase-like Zn-dependent dehydrogenase
MRALVVERGVSLDTRRTPPLPNDGEALLRVRKASVTALEREVARGHLGFRGVLGHEFVAVVDSVAGHANHPLCGRRVVAQVVTACGTCELCERGLSAHCRKRTIPGLLRRDGALADAMVMPVKGLTAVPESLDDDHAVFATTLAAAIDVGRQLTIEGKPFITVLGDGGLGLLTAQVMAKLNASVRVIGRHAAKLALCERWGIKHRHVDEVGRRADQDVVVDCTDSLRGLALAVQFVRPRGVIITKSIQTLHHDVNGDALNAPAALGASGNGFDRSALAAIVLNGITVIGSAFGPAAEALGMIARGEVDVVSLISRRMRLDDGPALLAASAKPDVVRLLVEI